MNTRKIQRLDEKYEEKGGKIEFSTGFLVRNATYITER